MNVDEEILHEVSIQVAIEMPFDIRSITCPTHRIRSKVRYFLVARTTFPDGIYFH